MEAETLFDELVERAARLHGSDVCSRFWSPGIRSRGWKAKGLDHRLRRRYTPAHLYRAISRAWPTPCARAAKIEQRSGTRIQRLRISGGGS